MLALKATFFSALFASSALAAPAPEPVAVAQPVAAPVVGDLSTYEFSKRADFGTQVLDAITRDLKQIEEDFEKAIKGQLDLTTIYNQVFSDITNDILNLLSAVESIKWFNFGDQVATVFGPHLLDLINALTSVQQDGLQLVQGLDKGQLPQAKSLLKGFHDISNLLLTFAKPVAELIPKVGKTFSSALDDLQKADDALYNAIQKI